MTFLILTRQGYDDLMAQGATPEAIWINPDVLSDDEIEQLRQRGVALAVLPERVDPHAPAEREAAALRLADDGPLWIEYARPEAAGALADTSPEAPSSRLPRALQQAQESAARLARLASRRLKRFAASDGAAIVIPYIGYGTTERLLLRGRVLKDEGFVTPEPGHSGWRNLTELYKRLGSDEVPGARLRARFQGTELEIVTDDNGYFQAELILPQPVAAGWQQVELALLDPPPAASHATASAEVLVPLASAKFGIISDIDDTVLWSNVTNKIRMLKMLAISNVHTRKPFKGVAAFYRALHAGADGNEANPLFYVSSSPWHLYTPLVDFLRSQNLPLGPLMLKELGVKSLFGAGRHQEHKLANIERIFGTYPHLPFVLIGDSGQEDPEIYRELVLRHPQRIKAIYIRNVNPDPERIEAIDRLAGEVRASGAQLVLVPDSEYAATHAAGEGLIAAGAAAEVRADKRGDESATAATTATPGA
ncbi:App1 family protein [Noviherbaspirillum soli]|uniref:App1 family protein n=1 Tax=Noviherbaspirillum soli TaxID=1064518 RepID=UPI00188DADD1|nr:phosphatase domain-containing protein [Noviherbaspirillum soli]